MRPKLSISMEDFFQKINSNLKIEHDLFIVRIFPHPMQYGHVYAPLTIPNICLGFYRSRPFLTICNKPFSELFTLSDPKTLRYEFNDVYSVQVKHIKYFYSI